jgi:4-hydroxy-L-threonine phosphate dehydrogenase PdxA
MIKLALATGDSDGVGPWIAAKALRKIFQQKTQTCCYYVFRNKDSDRAFGALSGKCRRHIFFSVAEALKHVPKSGDLVEIVLPSSAASWVFEAARLCKQKKLHGLVTGPLSKFKFRGKPAGHTEILSSVCSKKKLFQGYIGDHFSVALLTAHLPLRKVANTVLAPSAASDILLICKYLEKVLGPSSPRSPFGILGLNPHAGEAGLIGHEESLYMKPLLRQKKYFLHGPLVPDAVFSQKKTWKKYLAYIAIYHDQGLIPFKLVHGHSAGAQLTLGLPFVRTSVDHGTAKDLKNKALANEGSLLAAMKLCYSLTKKDY